MPYYTGSRYESYGGTCCPRHEGPPPSMTASTVPRDLAVQSPPHVYRIAPGYSAQHTQHALSAYAHEGTQLRSLHSYPAVQYEVTT